MNVCGSIRLDTLRKSRVNQLHIDNIGDILSRSEENPEEEENYEILGGLLPLFRYVNCTKIGRKMTERSFRNDA